MCKEKVEDHLREQGYLKYVKNALTTACNAEFLSVLGLGESRNYIRMYP